MSTRIMGFVLILPSVLIFIYGVVRSCRDGKTGINFVGTIVGIIMGAMYGLGFHYLFFS